MVTDKLLQEVSEEAFKKLTTEGKRHAIVMVYFNETDLGKTAVVAHGKVGSGHEFLKYAIQLLTNATSKIPTIEEHQLKE